MNSPSPWNGTPGKIHPQINGNIKRARWRNRHSSSEAAAKWFETQHPGMLTQMIQHHPPQPKTMRRQSKSPRKPSSQTKRSTPLLDSTKTPRKANNDNNDGTDNDNGNDNDNDNDDTDDDDAIDSPSVLSPGLLTKLFQDHSPPPTSYRKSIIETVPLPNAGLATQILERHPLLKRSQRKQLNPRNAQSQFTTSSSPRRPRSARRTYHHRAAASTSTSPRRQHCLPGEPAVSDQLGSWSPLHLPTRSCGKRSVLSISKRILENSVKLGLMTSESPQSPVAPDFVKTTVGSLLQSPMNQCMPFERGWGNTLHSFDMRMAVAGLSSPGQRSRGSRITIAKRSNTVTRANVRQKKDRKRIIYRAQARGDITHR